MAARIEAAALLLLLAACATLVQVKRADLRAVQRELTNNAISTGDISGARKKPTGRPMPANGQCARQSSSAALPIPWL